MRIRIQDYGLWVPIPDPKPFLPKNFNKLKLFSVFIANNKELIHNLNYQSPKKLVKEILQKNIQCFSIFLLV